MIKAEIKKGSDKDRAIAAVGNEEEIKTDTPLAEKDEEKQVEDEMRIRMANKKKTK
ncbi:hypothetical protein [Pedobacter endophyticus]|uniref:Uncharacterized protein n=1 Tax=Pedobacter endophyticus TaxID=2789740 RepID=A0A7S9L036_9SPHI|nr:hypothetical protein [Pedobacter endophyticus]QPH40020.1 hypothetical protein IZT61_01660 [Pedobacter endophyticus]